MNTTTTKVVWTLPRMVIIPLVILIPTATWENLKPIYDNIKRNEFRAFSRVKNGAGAEFHVSWSNVASVIVYVTDSPATKSKVITIGSYSKDADLFGISSLVWSALLQRNLLSQAMDLANHLARAIQGAASVLLGAAFSKLVCFLIQKGIGTSLSAAVGALARALSSMGLPALARVLPAASRLLGATSLHLLEVLPLQTEMMFKSPDCLGL
ncbi:hypothetical protein B0H14DRAFT_2599909 [Mycena olivaceomarginata]|nr:hypothetical protein B0H14DRAFT_2599909 [Mycena olivaceomarginata]